MTQAALARNSDPIQCHEAADRARRFAPSHRDRILAALKQHGPRTAHELERLTGLSVVQIDRRRIELVSMGLVRLLPGRRPTPTGGWAQAMEAV